MKKKRSLQSQSLGLNKRAGKISISPNLANLIFQWVSKSILLLMRRKPDLIRFIGRHSILTASFIWIFERVEPGFLSQWLQARAGRSGSRKKNR